MRDHADNAVVVCSIENIDPMGVHTGDSVTVAPQMTLSDEAYQELRDAAIAVIRAVGVDCGGSNIQFARERETGELRVIEMNPRVSRSSALASKATGYPIAKVAAKLAVGYTLDEIPNDLTGTTPASFEPTLDYVVVKFPRFAFEKFPGADTTLGTQMKSVGEAMGIGRTFGEAFLKARRSRELDGADAWELPGGRPSVVPRPSSSGSRPRRVRTWTISSRTTGCGSSGSASRTRRSRRRCGATEEIVRAKRRGWGVRPAYRRVDSCAAEVEAELELLLLHLGRGGRGPPDGAQAARRHPRLRPEPDRAGNRVRLLLRPRGAGVPRARLRGRDGQLQPGDGLDRLRHVGPPLLRAARRRGGARDLRPRAARTASSSSSGARPRSSSRAKSRQKAGGSSGRRSTRSTSPRIASASPPSATSSTSRVPPGRWPRSPSEAVYVAEAIGYPVLVRPSYVLGGRNMQVCYDDEAVARRRASGGRVLVDRFLEGAIEIDVDALCDGRETYVAAVMEHVEEAGIHSGDSSCVLPAPSLDAGDARAEIEDDRAAARARARRRRPRQRAARGRRRRGVRPRGEPAGLANRALREQGDGINLVEAACRLAAGARLAELDLPADPTPEAIQCQGRGAAVRALPGRRPRARPRDALDRRGDGERRRPPDRPREGRAGRRAGRCRWRGRRSSRCATRTSRRGRGRRLAVEARVPPRRNRGHRQSARGRADRRRARAQGDRAGGGGDRRRPRPPRPLRPRHQHALRRLGRALGRLPDPRGRARRPRPMHHDDRRRPRRGARDRRRPGRPRRLAPGAHQCAEESRLRVVANEAVGAVLADPSRARRARARHPRPVLHARGARARPAAPDEPLPGAARRAERSCSRRSGPAPARWPRSSPATRSTSSARSATATGSTSRNRSSSAAASASRRSRTSPSSSAARRRSSASAATGTRRPPRSSRTPRSSSSQRSSRSP